MTDSQCVDYLENICKMFVNGSKNCEGQALEYQQNYISAIRHAIAKLQGDKGYAQGYIDGSTGADWRGE